MADKGAKHEESAFEDNENIKKTSVAEDTEAESVPELEPEDLPVPVTMQSPKRSFWAKLHSKKVWIPAVIIVVLAALAAVPFTRFAIAGTFLRQTFKVKVLDQETNQPVSSAMVSLNGSTVKTDGQGMASLKVKVGSATLGVSKKYYQSTTQKVTVPILKQKQTAQVRIKATGRQVTVNVTNLISGQPVADVKVSAAGTEATTDKTGKTIIVLPANQTSVVATLLGTGYNNAKVTLKVSTDPTANNVTVTPAGMVYFLSNQSGAVDVVKANLDGTNRQTVLAGTGKEDRYSTTLLATHDWKYLAFYANRDGTPKLYLIDTSTDKLITMDEGDVNFGLVGWVGHRFVYYVNRTSYQNWQANKQAVKSFNADNSQIATLDQTTVDGDRAHYAYQTFADYHLVQGKVTYSAKWSVDAYYGSTDPLLGKTDVLRGVDADGQNKKDLQGWTHYSYSNLNFNMTGLNQLGTMVTNKDGSSTFYQYDGSTMKQLSTMTTDQFYANSHIYLNSPAGGQTLWADNRDGKVALLVGDQNGNNGKPVAAFSRGGVYGWFTSDYILIEQNNNEVDILPAVDMGNAKPIKISDYLASNWIYFDYDGGYGGR